MRKRWSDVAIRMVRQVYTTLEAKKGASQAKMLQAKTNQKEMLQAPIVNMALRGEALRFERVNKKAANDKTYKSIATMRWGRGETQEEATPKCKLVNDICEPEAVCTKHWSSKLGLGLITKDRWCEPKRAAIAAIGAWFPVTDPTLVAVVSRNVESGQSRSLIDYRGLKMSLRCGTKRQFFDDAFSPTTSFIDCVTKGVETNAVLRAKEPWKLYFPDEVVVVAKFQELTKRYCSPRDDAVRNELCNDAEERSGTDHPVDGHVVDGTTGDIKMSLQKSMTDDDKYMGIHTGAGWPQATPDWVALQPQDILESLGLIKDSHGR
jgi:hypothetical protein